MYGMTWSLAFAGVGHLLSRLSDLLPDDEPGLLWAGALGRR